IATASISSSCSARITRTAISPRFATNTRENIRDPADGRPRRRLRCRPKALPVQPSQPGLPWQERSQPQRPSIDRFQLDKNLAELHRLRVADVDRADDRLDIRLDLVHQLHRLEDAERLAGANRVPLLDE